MNYQVKLNDNNVVTLTNVDFDASTFTNALNDPAITFVNFSGAIVHKCAIVSILPIVGSDQETE